MFWVLNFLKKMRFPRVSSGIIVVLLLILVGMTALSLYKKNEEPELGGPNQTTVLIPKQNSFLYEKREILAYRPNGFHRVQVSGFLRDFTPNAETLLYSYIDDPFERTAKQKMLIPTARVTRAGYVFLSGVGEKNFVILNRFSDNITEQYSFLKDHAPFGNFLELNGHVYFTKSDQKLYEHQNKKTKVFMGFSFPENFYPKLEGFSADHTALYVGKGGSVSYAELLRINLDDRSLTVYGGIKGARNDQVRVCPEQRRAIYVKHALDPTAPHYGKPVGPSSVMMHDLESDTSTELISSQFLFENLRVACGAERLIVQENGEWRVLTFEGKFLQHALARQEKVITLSADGKKIVVSIGEKTLLRNIKSSDPEWEVKNDIPEKDGEEPRIRYNVVGTLQSP